MPLGVGGAAKAATRQIFRRTSGHRQADTDAAAARVSHGWLPVFRAGGSEKQHGCHRRDRLPPANKWCLPADWCDAEACRRAGPSSARLPDQRGALPPIQERVRRQVGLARTGFHWGVRAFLARETGVGWFNGVGVASRTMRRTRSVRSCTRLVSATSVAVKPSSIDGGFAPWLISRPKGSGTLGTDVLHQTN
jgi:hypothetical protein